MSYYFSHVLHNLECIAGRFLSALKRHTRVVKTSDVAERDQRRKRAPFAKGGYIRSLCIKFICEISCGCFRF